MISSSAIDHRYQS